MEGSRLASISMLPAALRLAVWIVDPTLHSIRDLFGGTLPLWGITRKPDSEIPHGFVAMLGWFRGLSSPSLPKETMGDLNKQQGGREEQL